MSTCRHCRGTGECNNEFHDEHFDPVGFLEDFIEDLLTECPSCGNKMLPRPACPHCDGKGYLGII